MSELKFEPGDFDCIVGYHSEDSDRIAKLVNKRIAPLVAENARLKERDKQWQTKWERTVDSLAKAVLSKGDIEAELTAIKAKLENAPVVYGISCQSANGNKYSNWSDSQGIAASDTHTARLVDIKELAK